MNYLPMETGSATVTEPWQPETGTLAQGVIRSNRWERTKVGAGTGIEPVAADYESAVLPLNYPACASAYYAVPEARG